MFIQKNYIELQTENALTVEELSAITFKKINFFIMPFLHQCTICKVASMATCVNITDWRSNPISRVSSQERLPLGHRLFHR